MILVLHFLDGFQAQERETLGHDICGGFTQSHSVHVDVDDLTGGSVFLHAITNVIEFRESSADFVKEFTERMKAQVKCQTDNRLGEPQQQFGQFHFLFVAQWNSVGSCFFYLLIRHVGSAGDASNPGVGVKEVHSRVAFVLQHLSAQK